MDVQRTLWLQDNPAQHATSDRLIRTLPCVTSATSNLLEYESLLHIDGAADQQGGSKQAEPQQGNLK
jgi:hypothetical protein